MPFEDSIPEGEEANKEEVIKDEVVESESGAKCQSTKAPYEEAGKYDRRDRSKDIQGTILFPPRGRLSGFNRLNGKDGNKVIEQDVTETED